MKAQFKVNKNLVLEIEEDTQADLFQGLASSHEVFGQSNCGACKSENIGPRVRTNDGNDYYEMVCKDCRAVLSYGLHQGKARTLFPHRKNKEGAYKKNNGWEKWEPNKEATSN